jgi:predicted transcriptional regulator
MSPVALKIRKIKKFIRFFIFIALALFLCYASLNSLIFFLWGDPSVNGIPRLVHPPEILILHYLGVISPGLTRLVLTFMFWSFGMIMYLGFQQITPKSSLEHPLRERIIEYIRFHPGRHFSTIMRETGINRGTLYYHIHKLKSLGKLTEQKDGGLTRYFVRFTGILPLQKKIIARNDNPVRARILGILATQTSCSRKTLITSLKMSGPALWYHLHMLENDGIILAETDKNHVGRAVWYSLTQNAAEILEFPGMIQAIPKPENCQNQLPPTGAPTVTGIPREPLGGFIHNQDSPALTPITQ